METQTPEVANGQNETAEPKIDQAKLERLEQDLKDLKASFKDKVYGVKVNDEDTLALLVNFVTNEAEWTGNEALGIEELSKALNNIKIKSGLIFLKNLEVEALFYFISKGRGTGLESAQRFLKILRAVNEAIKLVKNDNQKQIQLEQQVEAVRNGIDIEPPVEKTEEK